MENHDVVSTTNCFGYVNPNNTRNQKMFKKDKSIIFKDLLNASIKNEFGFQEQDILPLFIKYQSKRQLLINTSNFLSYVLQLGTHFYSLVNKKSKITTGSK